MDYEQRQENYQKFKDIAYYFIIGLISFVSVAFLPFVGSIIAGEFQWPTTAIGWAIWAGTKILVAVINIIIFDSYLKQAKINIKDDKNYLKALELLAIVNKTKTLRPRSPKRYFGGVWGKKGTTLFISSVLSAIIFAEAILKFDLATFLSYLFTIFMAVIFGYLQMRSTEDYWTVEFLAYTEEEIKIMNLKESAKAEGSEVVETIALEVK